MNKKYNGNKLIKYPYYGIRKQGKGMSIMGIRHSVQASSLAEVVDRILTKGIVIDAFVRVALVGIELLALEIRAVIASVETYLMYAEAVGLTVSPSSY